MMDVNELARKAAEEIAKHFAPLAEQLKKGCQCICHTMPDHSKLQDAAEANMYHVGELKRISDQNRRLREALVRVREVTDTAVAPYWVTDPHALLARCHAHAELALAECEKEEGPCQQP